MITNPVARTSDLRPGERRLVEVSDEKILLLRTFDGQWRAFAPTCPHAGAPLEKGALCGSRLICPWHKSCFSALDGALLESPSLESLPAYSLEIVGEEVRVDPGSSTQMKHSPDHGKVSPRADQTFVILGGGAAGAAAVRELRGLGFAGGLVMISQEHRAPYDRTLLSKMYLSGQAESTRKVAPFDSKKRPFLLCNMTRRWSPLEENPSCSRRPMKDLSRFSFAVWRTPTG